PPTCLFFFSSRRRHTRFSRDWSSDVCSSDLEQLEQALQQGPALVQFREPAWAARPDAEFHLHQAFLQVVNLCQRYQARCLVNSLDRKSVVEGKSVDGGRGRDVRVEKACEQRR